MPRTLYQEVSRAQGMIHAQDAVHEALAYLCYGLHLLQGIIHVQDALHEALLLLCRMPDLLLLYYSMLTYADVCYIYRRSSASGLWRLMATRAIDANKLMSVATGGSLASGSLGSIPKSLLLKLRLHNSRNVCVLCSLVC
jgi:hypothetical protein